MITIFNREFVVDATVETAWAHHAKIEKWPSWARDTLRMSNFRRQATFLTTQWAA